MSRALGLIGLAMAMGSPAGAQTAAAFRHLGFRPIGPATMSGRIVDLAVNESNPYEFYAASATGGVWKTADNGITWTPVFEREASHSVGAIAVDQTEPNVVWVGTGEATNRQSSGWGDGVYRSGDGGKTWRNMGLEESHHIARIAIDPTNSDRVFVAVPGHLWGPNPDRGLYRSTDGGQTWELVLSIDEDTGVTDVAIDPAMPNVIYAAAYQRRRAPFGFVGGGPGSGLYRSVDGGTTWQRQSTGLPTGVVGRIGISIYRKDPRIVYLSVEQGLRYTSSVSYDKRLAGIFRSEDRGETWRQMSDWNPRPAYSSQIRVDPTDQSRIYMVSYSVSDDSGKTFRAPRQSLHGDDRVVWVDPRDSRHLIKADDGGVGISYDRGVKWLYLSSLPVSQFYHVSVGKGAGYLVCGGLQDNGSFCGPSRSTSSQGIGNDDWFRVGGGDGFHNVIDTSDGRTVYSSSQYLGLTRVDLRTLESTAIRPTVKEGEGPKLGSWGAPDPKVGRKIPPAGWNSPVAISHFAPGTIYAGMSTLWTSIDRGNTWRSLGDLTTGVDRRTLAIMGQLPEETTLSLDDGVSYYPTSSAFSESPRMRGLLYAGTDDGNLQVSRNGGRAWTNVIDRVPGLPKGTWVSWVEASRHVAGTVYAAFDGHQADDYTNYLYRSSDFGRTWTSIVGDLPAERVVHLIREDLRNSKLLYLGTEFGFYFSPDGGGHWIGLQNNLPTLPINDFALHPTENDLVLGTHGRGIWIFDQLSALQELTPTVMGSAAHVFTVRPAEMTRYANTGAHAGDMVYRGQNPPNGAIIDYWAGNGVPGGSTLAIVDSRGNEVFRDTLMAESGAAVHRYVWNLRLPPLRGRRAGGDDDGEDRGELPGRYVAPGTYLARINLGGRNAAGQFAVKEDPRVSLTPSARAQWHSSLDRIATLYRSARTLAGRADTAVKREGASAADKAVAATAGELVARIATLYGNVLRASAPPTADQRAQMAYFPTVLTDLGRRQAR